MAKINENFPKSQLPHLQIFSLSAPLLSISAYPQIRSGKNVQFYYEIV